MTYRTQIAVLLICLASAINAQNMPNYLPTDGLVGWWPFNGNANDESGNGHNGAVNGATLTTDRFGNANKAYSFDGVSNFIKIEHADKLNFSDNYTLSSWYLTNSLTQVDQAILGKGSPTGWTGYQLMVNTNYTPKSLQFGFNNQPTVPTINGGAAVQVTTANLTGWHLLSGTYDGEVAKLYLDGVLVHSYGVKYSLPVSTTPLLIGNETLKLQRFFLGKIDDVALWNRALTQEEIFGLYQNKENNCVDNLSIEFDTIPIQKGSTTRLITNSSDTITGFTWQSDFGQGFQTLLDYGSYSGVNTDTLRISNVQLVNHNQPFRVIASKSGICFDTSEVVRIQIADTCVQVITDTTFITVTDTLIIHTMVTDINTMPVMNTIKVFPNPTSTHVTIDYGNFTSLKGYKLRVTNAGGQFIFQTDINRPSDLLSLSDWGGKGLYFIFIVDPQGNTIDIRKIVLQ